MEFLNIGWGEIIFILVIAFILLGPDRIKDFARDLGRWIRKLSQNEHFREAVHTSDEIRNFPRKVFDEALLDDISPSHQIDPQDYFPQTTEPESIDPGSEQKNDKDRP